MPRRTNDDCKGVRSGSNSSSSGRLVPHGPWEREGSDMLPGGRGIATSAASSLDSVDLLVLAVKMACNILRVEYPVENGRILFYSISLRSFSEDLSHFSVSLFCLTLLFLCIRKINYLSQPQRSGIV